MTCRYSYAADCSECNERRCPYIDHMGEDVDEDESCAEVE